MAYLSAVQTNWTIYKNGLGGATLASINSTGPASLSPHSLALSNGFWRGLTWAPGHNLFYALYSNGSDPLHLYALDPGANSVVPLFAGPAVGFGGMTWTGPGQLTALFTNAQGQFQLHAIDLASQTVTPFGVAFTNNRNGGLAWDNSTGLRYFAIGSGDSGYSSLYSIVADGSACGQQSGLGGGYFYAAFTMAGDSVSPPPGSPVPEPGPLALVLSGLAAIGFSRLVRGLRARALDGTAAPDRGPEMSP